MGDRITSKWTASTIEAFGDNPNVRLGRAGEEAVLNEVKSWAGWETLDHEEDYALQLQGIDISVKKDTWSRFYTVDVKTGRSYLDEYGTIKLDLTESGWLLNPKKTSDRVWHVNLDTGWMAWYDRKDMIKYVKENVDARLDQFNIPPKLKVPCVYRRKLTETNKVQHEDIPF